MRLGSHAVQVHVVCVEALDVNPVLAGLMHAAAMYSWHQPRSVAIHPAQWRLMPKQQERARTPVWALEVFQMNQGCSAALAPAVCVAALGAMLVKGAHQLVVQTAWKLPMSPVVIRHA